MALKRKLRDNNRKGGGQKKMKNNKKKNALRWKPMAIASDAGFNLEDFTGLAGIEELDGDQYEMIRSDKKRKMVTHEVEDVPEEEEEAAAVEEDLKPKKKKKNKDQNKKLKVDDEVIPEDEQIEFEDNPDEEDDNPEPEEEPTANLDMSAWSALSVPSNIIENLRELRMTKPTPIQESTIPDAINSREHVYGAAATGSGKTLAFAIPMVTHILEDLESEDQEQQLRGIVLTPTRELAVQIKKHIEAITRGTKLRTALVVGGLAIQKQQRILSKAKPDIVVATPGRLWEIINSGTVPYLSRSSIGDIRYLVIDEADRMVEKSHFQELKMLMGLMLSLDTEARKERQIFIFSATLTLKKKAKQNNKSKKPDQPDESDLISLLRLDRHNLKTVDLTEGGSKSTPNSDRLEEKIIHTLKTDKDLYLYYFLSANQGRSIVFCNSIDCIRRLVNLLKFLNFTPLAVHSSMPQKRRLTSIERFTSNSNAILIATDVAARGLDIPSVNHVIHYQCPRTAEIYVHRSGRTARIDQSGLSLILCDPTEEAFFLKDFCRILNKQRTDLKEYETNSLVLKKMKERIRLAQVCDQLEHQLRKERTQEDWFKDAKKAAELFDSEDEGSEVEDPDRNLSIVDKAKNRRKLKAYRAQLSALLKKKIVVPRGV